MYKKAWCTCEVVVLPCQAITYLTFASPPHLNCDPSKTTKQLKRFCDSSAVPLFLIRKEENKSFPCTHKLGERTGQVWRDNSRRVRTHEKNSGETVRRLGTIIQSIFVPNQEPASAWIFGNGPVRVGTQGLFRPYLKTFVPPFLPTRLTVPGSPRMVVRWRYYQILSDRQILKFS